MKKIFSALLFTVIFAVSSQAQDIQHFSLQYSFGIATGSTNDFISKASFRGISMDYKNFGLTDQIALGLSFKWNTFFKEADYDTYEYNTISVSGKQFRYLNCFPMLATADYFVKSSESYVRPFVGLGVGTLHSIKTVDMGLYSFENREWHFALKPQAGVWVGFDDATKFTLTTDYLYAFKTSDTDSRQYLTINAGFVFVP